MSYSIIDNGVKYKPVHIGFPIEYQEVEYIHAYYVYGAQYIDTKYYPNENTSFECVYLVDEPNTYHYVLGTWDSLNNAFVITVSPQNTFLRCGGANNFPFVSLFSIKATAICSLTSATLNGITQTLANVSTATRTTKPILLFARYNAGTIQTSSSSIKMYSCKIYESGILVRDFVPCYRKSDNVIGMYDLANNRFYKNAGTGTFLKGNDVNNFHNKKIKMHIGG